MEQNKLIKNILYVTFAIIIALTGFYGGVITERTTSLNGKFITQAMRIEKLSRLIDENYYFKDKIDKDKAFDTSMIGYLSALQDPFSYYLDESDLTTFNEDISGDYVGIGVEIVPDTNNIITITGVFMGGAAEKVGIKAGDKLIKVYGETVTGDMLNAVVEKIRGLPGGEVNLDILRPDGTEQNLTLIRQHITIERVITKNLDNNIGYVRLTKFDENTADEFIRKMDTFDFSQMKGLIVDVRSNPGGMLTSVIGVADYLMPEGIIATAKYSDGKEESYKSDAKCVTVPIAVLINGGSASASEFLAGGLRDNNQALLIGENSLGKGTVGQPFKLDSKTSVVLTIGEYYLPSGKSIHKVGLEPDIEVLLENVDISLSLLPDSEDNQLQQAISALLAQ